MTNPNTCKDGLPEELTQNLRAYCYAGLNNRIRIMVGLAESMALKFDNPNLEFVWTTVRHCPNAIKDMLTVDGVSIIENHVDINTEVLINGCCNDHTIINKYFPGQDTVKISTNAWKRLHFRDDLIQQASDEMKNVKTSFHIRTTDLDQLKASLSIKPVRFINVVKAIKSKVKEGLIFIACDDLGIRQLLCKIIGKENIHIASWQKSIDNKMHGVRQTDLKYAILDLLACTTTTNFIGTYLSSFTTTIEIMRRQKGYNNNPHM